MGVISYPGSTPTYDPPQYTIMERRPPGPWHTSRISMGMTDQGEAIRAAQARCQWEDYLIVKVVDQRGKVYWTNEGPTDGLPTGKDA